MAIIIGVIGGLFGAVLMLGIINAITYLVNFDYKSLIIYTESFSIFFCVGLLIYISNIYANRPVKIKNNNKIVVKRQYNYEINEAKNIKTKTFSIYPAKTTFHSYE